MIDANRLLGSLLSSGVGRRRSGFGSRRGTGMALGMGILGMAFAAFEHLNKSRKNPKSSASETPRKRVSKLVSTPVGGAPPPLPSDMPSNSAPPTPPPPSIDSTPPTSDVASSSSPAATDEEAKLYLRAMISAAACDGNIDQQEKDKIFGKLEASELSDEEREFLINEMDWPMSLDEIVAGVKTRKQGMQIYLASILAIEVDTDAEREYLGNLSKLLNIKQDILDSIHTHFNISI